MEKAAYWIAVLGSLLALGAPGVSGDAPSPAPAAVRPGAALEAPASPALSEAERRAASWERVRAARDALDRAWES